VRPVDLDRATFDRFAAASGEVLVSIFLPTQVRGDEVDQGRIRLKNLLADADEALQTVGWRSRQRDARLTQARDLLDDVEFWQHQQHGLVVYVDEEGHCTSVALPAGADERVVVANTFHLRPLLPSLEPLELPVLAMTMSGVRLYRVTQEAIRKVPADLPKSFEDVNWFVDREKQRQQHADRAGGQGLRHGHEPSDARHEDVSRFLRAVEDAIPPTDSADALIVLGDVDLVARFAVLSEREILAGRHVADVDDEADLREAAGPLLVERERSAMSALLDIARTHLSTESAITDLAEALEAAVSGRVDRLLLRRELAPAWGRFDPATLELSIDREQRPLLVDLYDRLAVHAMGTGAAVTTTKEAIDGRDFVAVPRY